MIVRLGYVAISNKLGKKATISSTVTYSNYQKILSDEKKIEKIYFIKDDQLSKFEELLDDVPIEYFQIAEMIAEKATRDLNVSLDNQILVALADHIYFAVERYYKNANMSNFLNSEISYLYRKGIMEKIFT